MNVLVKNLSRNNQAITEVEVDPQDTADKWVDIYESIRLSFRVCSPGEIILIEGALFLVTEYHSAGQYGGPWCYAEPISTLNAIEHLERK